MISYFFSPTFPAFLPKHEVRQNKSHPRVHLNCLRGDISLLILPKSNLLHEIEKEHLQDQLFMISFTQNLTRNGKHSEVGLGTSRGQILHQAVMLPSISPRSQAR